MLLVVSPYHTIRAFLSLARFWRARERLHESSKVFVAHALHVAWMQIRTQA